MERTSGVLVDESEAVLRELAACWEATRAQERWCIAKCRTAMSRSDLTAEDVADALGVSRSTLFRMLREIENGQE